MQLRTAPLALAIALASTAASAAPPPLVFEAAREGFVARGAAWSAALGAEGVTLLLARPSPYGGAGAQSPAPVTLRMRVDGANPHAALRGESALASVSHVLVGSDPAQWRHAVPHFARVRAANVRPGVDVVYYGNPTHLETDYEIAAGADPAVLALVFEGADALRVDADGALVVHAGGVEMRELRPIAYQQDGGARIPVEARFEVVGPDRVRVALGAYDRTKRLVIDPVLAYSTYAGGALSDFGRRVAADALGNSYVTGRTLSLDFPTSSPLQPSFGGGAYDAFVTKIDAQGAVLWSTYLGGSGEDRGADVDVDAQGYLYLVGRTDSPDLPVLRAIQPTLAGATDSFVAKLRPDGSGFVFLSYLGGTGSDEAQGVAADGRGRLVAVGSTSSPDHPLASPLQSVYGGGASDAWLAILSPFGDRLELSTLLGGGLADVAANVEVDAQDRPVVTGSTDSADFPVANAVQAARAGASDAFVAKIDPTAHALVFSTYLGGSGNGAAGDEVGADVALDPAGNVYVAGRTRSADFPVVAALQAVLLGGEDAFVTKLAPGGAPILYSTHLGGSAGDEARAIAVNAAGLAFVTGRTASADFPTASPLQATHGGGGADAFVTVLAPNGASLLESTFLGGNDADDGFGLALDAQSNVFVSGETASANYPTLHAAQPVSGGHGDAFATKLLEASEIAVRLAPPLSPGAGARLTVELANGAQTAKLVEMKVWIEGPGLAPTSLVGATAPRIALPAGGTQTLLSNQALPPTLVFPGATVGARLLDGASGAVLSESTCQAVPCH